MLVAIKKNYPPEVGMLGSRGLFDSTALKPYKAVLQSFFKAHKIKIYTAKICFKVDICPVCVCVLSVFTRCVRLVRITFIWDRKDKRGIYTKQIRLSRFVTEKAI